jgi:hypothetical protein
VRGDTIFSIREQGADKGVFFVSERAYCTFARFFYRKNPNIRQRGGLKNDESAAIRQHRKNGS